MSDGICRECLLPNPTWFATNALWNAVTEHWTEPEFPGRARIMCPSCFIGLAESQGMVPTAWILTPEMPSRKWTHEWQPAAPTADDDLGDYPPETYDDWADEPAPAPAAYDHKMFRAENPDGPQRLPAPPLPAPAPGGDDT